MFTSNIISAMFSKTVGAVGAGRCSPHKSGLMAEGMLGYTTWFLFLNNIN